MRSLFVALAVLCTGAVALADEPVKQEESKPWSVALSTAFLSDYMWRGFNLYDGASIQPTVTGTYDTGYGEVSANLWFHLSSEGDRQAEKFFEMDDTISYSYTFEPVTLSVGHVWYTYPNGNDDIKDSAEWFAAVALDDGELNEFFSLSPKLSFYQDYRVTDAQYYELGFSHKFEPGAMGEGFNVTPYVNFGFASNAEKAYSDSGGLVHVTYGVSSSVKWGDLELVPSLNYTSKVDDATTNEFWFGASVNYGL